MNVITEPTEHWASLDQYTSFAKDPWGFDRPENRKEHSVLSRATFVEWPNTTSNFSLQRGVAPPGKLAAHHKSRFLGLRRGGSETVSPSSAEQKATAKQAPSSAISDAHLRASVCINNGAKPRSVRTTPAATPCVAPNKTTPRNSADNVTAAYTLLQQAAAQQNTAPSTKTEAGRRARPQTKPLSASRGDTPQQRQQAGQQQDPREGGRRSQQPSSLSHDWSMTNIGFNNIKSEARARMERENREGYERAAFASRDADKPYIAEATHFRFRYPHTLGRIQALSRVRGDRADARREQARASDSRNPQSTRAL